VKEPQENYTPAHGTPLKGNSKELNNLDNTPKPSLNDKTFALAVENHRLDDDELSNGSY